MLARKCGTALKIKPDNTTNKQEQPYMPLELKSVLARCGLRQADWSAEIKQQGGKGAGKALSSSAATKLLNWNVWPKLTSSEYIKAQTEKLLRKRGASEEDIAIIWDVDTKDHGRHTHPVYVHLGQKKVTNPFINELPEAVMLSKAAKKHHKLFIDPFVNDVQNENDVFLDSDQQYIRSAMHQTAKHGGFLAVVGESGAGKTTLRRDLLDKIQRDNEDIIVIQPRIIDKARLTTGAICDAIVQDISPTIRKLPQTLEAKARLIEKLLTGSSRAGNQHVLMIEEAHDLTIKTLKYLKRFWELEDGFRKLMSIILIGQPELKTLLDERSNYEAREVIRRCEIAELHPLNGNLEKYLELKFKRVAPERALSDFFAPDAFDAIRDRLFLRKRGVGKGGISMMYPLVVNNAVTKAMNLAADIGAARISAEIIREV